MRIFEQTWKRALKRNISLTLAFEAQRKSFSKVLSLLLLLLLACSWYVVLKIDLSPRRSLEFFQMGAVGKMAFCCMLMVVAYFIYLVHNPRASSIFGRFIHPQKNTHCKVCDKKIQEVLCLN
ncbi:hypothetical protein CEXT_733861 [Caerostris extrusa]|uniref:Uncharacterized protein n=1 Tax=Caerostris extrusa TaxID=172846 RepID=A0AAV4UZ61_CAEEX|nr:hypothetical protein CEXT_733861 [Caerostris extrusa]